MEITGKIFKILPEITGESKNGQWRKQNFVIETEGEFPKKICILTWGDKIDLNSYKEGDEVKVLFDIESREYQEKWYTDIKAWRVELTDKKNVTPLAPEEPPVNFDDVEENEVLPF